MSVNGPTTPWTVDIAKASQSSFIILTSAFGIVALIFITCVLVFCCRKSQTPRRRNVDTQTPFPMLALFRRRPLLPRVPGPTVVSEPPPYTEHAHSTLPPAYEETVQFSIPSLPSVYMSSLPSIPQAPPSYSESLDNVRTPSHVGDQVNYI